MTDQEYDKFKEYVQKNDKIYSVVWKDRSMKRVMKNVPEMDNLNDIILAIVNYQPYIEKYGFDIDVVLDDKKYEVYINSKLKSKLNI